MNDVTKIGKNLQNEIYQILKSKAGYVFEIQTIKACLSQVCFKIFIPNDDSHLRDLAMSNTTLKLSNGFTKL